MSIVGVDFGTAAFTVANAAGAGAQRGGITIVLNEGTSRFTAGLVCFHENKRHVGHLAAPMMRAQFKNTITRLKCFIGRKYSDPTVQHELQNIHYKVVQLENDEIGMVVTHNNEELTFSPTQLLAMQLANIVEFTQLYSGKKNVEMVVTVPAFFTDAQRRAVRDAAAIANVRLLKLINESTAAALSYGIFRRAKFSEDEKKPTNVMFVDMGQTNFSATVVAFTKQGIQVKGCSYERNVGGYYIDKGIADVMAEQFEKKSKIDIRQKPKSYIKALIAAEKLKKTLSPDGVNLAKSSIECLYQEHDFRFQLTQDEFNELFQPLADRIERPILDALKMAGLTPADLDSVEMIGGGVRVPIIKKKIATVLGTDIDATNYGLSATLNQDECVARGGALQCAMLSPSIRVVQYALRDVISYPIQISWDQLDADKEAGKPNHIELLKCGDNFPSFKQITFNRKGQFNVYASYSDPENLPAGTNPNIGTFKIGDDKTLQPVADETPKVRVIMAFDEDGTFNIRSAEYMKQKPPEEPVEEAADAADAAAAADAGTDGEKKPEGGDADAEKKPESGDADAEKKPESGDADAEKQPEGGDEKKTEGGDSADGEKKDDAIPLPKKKQYTVISLGIGCEGIAAMSTQELNAARDNEARMAQAERVLRERDEKRNDLETAIYSFRDQLTDENYNQFITEDAKEQLTKLLDQYEDWIYTEEGFDGQKSLFTERLDKLSSIGGPMLTRKRQFEERPVALAAFKKAMTEQLTKVNNQDEKYAHLTTEDREQVRKIWADADAELQGKVAEQEAKGKTVVVLDVPQIQQRTRTAVNQTLPIVNKPKPAPEPEPEPEKKEDAKKAEEPAKEGEGDKKEGEEKADAPAEADAAAASAEKEADGKATEEKK